MSFREFKKDITCDICGKSGYKSITSVKRHQVRSKVCRAAALHVKEETNVAKVLSSIGGTLIESNRDRLKEFIRENLSEYDIGRGHGFEYLDPQGDDNEDDEVGQLGGNVTRLERLFQFNDQHIDNLSESEARDLDVLRCSIINGFSTMDKESMVPFDASGFVFSTDGKLIVFNER